MRNFDISPLIYFKDIANYMAEIGTGLGDDASVWIKDSANSVGNAIKKVVR